MYTPLYLSGGSRPKSNLEDKRIYLGDHDDRKMGSKYSSQYLFTTDEATVEHVRMKELVQDFKNRNWISPWHFFLEPQIRLRSYGEDGNIVKVKEASRSACTRSKVKFEMLEPTM